MTLTIDASDVGAIIDAAALAADSGGWSDLRRARFCDEFSRLADSAEAVRFHMDGGRLEATATPQLLDLLRRYGVIDGVL